MKRAAASIDGTAGTEVVDRLGLAVHDRLGREVELEDVTGAEVDEDDTSADYEVRLAGRSDGPAACLEVQPTGDLGGPEYTLLSVAEGACDR